MDKSEQIKRELGSNYTVCDSFKVAFINIKKLVLKFYFKY
jgi:hypothetical protein